MLNCIGIDVSKSSLNIHIAKNGQDLKIDNTLAAVKKLYTKLKKIYKKEVEELVFVFEPTNLNLRVKFKGQALKIHPILML